MMPDLAQVRHAGHAAQDGLQPAGPFQHTRLIADQILPDFDQHMGKATPGAVAVHCVVFQGSVVRLIVADDKRSIRRQGFENGHDRTRILVPQQPRMPGPRGAAPDRRIAVDRHDDRRRRLFQHGIQRRGDTVMIGPVIERNAPLPLRRIMAGIAGHNGTIGQAHHQRRIILPPVGIDQQAREGRHQRGRGKPPCQFQRQRPHADVIGDMPFKLCRRQPQIAIFGRQGVAGMIAQQQQAAGKIPVNGFDRLKCGRVQVHCSGMTVERMRNSDDASALLA